MTSIAESFVDDGFHFRPTEAEKIDSWRLWCALELGCSSGVAEKYAASKADRERLEALIRQGCPPDLAVEIEA